jgi:TonB dependent receptor
LALGENLVTFGYDRRSDDLALDGGPEIAQSVATFRFVADLQLSRLSRLEIGDALGSGTSLPHRDDPQVALLLRPGNNVTLRFAAGSAYATVPEELVAAAGAGERFAPETSFGYRASADIATHAGDHVRAAAFEVQRFDSFAELADARSAGLEFGFEREALPGRLGIDAGLDLTRTQAFGPEQPYLRALLATPSIAGEQLAGDPYSKARLALTYDTNAVEFRVGATLLGANNALADHAVALAGLSLRLRIASVADVRFGFENAFGQAVLDPELAPLYPPREITLTLER